MLRNKQNVTSNRERIHMIHPTSTVRRLNGKGHVPNAQKETGMNAPDAATVVVFGRSN